MTKTSSLKAKLALKAQRVGMAAKPATKNSKSSTKPAKSAKNAKIQKLKAAKEIGIRPRIAQMKGGDVIELDLNSVAENEYYAYGVSVIEDRAIFSGIDGLKPVARRSLYAVYELGLHSGAKPDKSAKAVGATLGNYHPHGDTACYDAIVNAASNQNIPMIHGAGNFGTMTEGPAAMRYTNLKLSRYSDMIFFDKFYLPTVEYVPNYDGSRMEPLVLPALMPNAVLNGNFGISPGVNTRSPMFTLDSVMAVLQEVISNKGVCTPEMCLKLEFTTATGGKAIKTKESKANYLEFYRTGKATVPFASTSTDVDKTNSIRFNRFAPLSDMEKVMTRVEEIKGVQSTRDDSEETDPCKTAFVITFAKTLKGAALQTAIAAVHKEMSASYRYDVKVTDRYVDSTGQAAAKLRSTTTPEMLQDWLKYRVGIEIQACTYWTGEASKRIAYLELMRLAISKLDLIFKHVKNKRLDDAGLVKAIVKDLKVTEEQANQILARNLRQLRHLEDEKLVDTIKSIQKEIKGYQKRIKNPMAFISEQLIEMHKTLKAKGAK